jgi:hypothetical protein
VTDDPREPTADQTPKEPPPIPGWTSDMEGEPPIGILPDGTLNVVDPEADDEE